MSTKSISQLWEKLNLKEKSKNPFRYYDAEKVVYGRKMKDWFKFMAYWHTLCAEGRPVYGPTKVFVIKEKIIGKSQKQNGCRV